MSKDDDPQTAEERKQQKRLDRQLKKLDRITDSVELAELLSEAMDLERSSEDLIRIVEAGADVNYREESDDYTFLMEAARHGDLRLVKVLVDAGADTDELNWLNETALAVAASWCHREVFDYLLPLTDKEYHELAFESLPEEGVTAENRRFVIEFVEAAGEGNLETVQRLLESGIDVNVREPERKFTALTAACASGHLAIVRRLIEAGADLNKIGADDCTPLMWASDATVCFTLIDAGADTNLVAKAGTALMMQANRGNIEVMERLLKDAGDINAMDDDGYTALSYAVSGNQPEAVRLLLDAGADVLKTDRMGRCFYRKFRRPDYCFRGTPEEKQELLKMLEEAAR